MRPTRAINAILLQSYTLSVAGPWLCNLVSVYFLTKFSDSALSLEAVAFYLYTAVAIIFQMQIVPSLFGLQPMVSFNQQESMEQIN